MEEKQNRRQFLFKSLGVAGTALIAGSSLSMIGCEEVEQKTPTGPPTNTNMINIDVTDPDFSELAAVGGIVPVTEGALRLMIFRKSETEAISLSRVCTHSQCDLSPQFGGTKIDDDTIECGCHASRFNLLSGAVERGPANADLVTYPATVNGDIISIDIS